MVEIMIGNIDCQEKYRYKRGGETKVGQEGGNLEDNID